MKSIGRTGIIVVVLFWSALLCFAVAPAGARVSWLGAEVGPEASGPDRNTDAFLQSLGGRMRLVSCTYDGATLLSLTPFQNGSVTDSTSRWASTVTTTRVAGESDALDVTITFALQKGLCQQAGVAVAFDFSDWSTENYVMLPASVYRGNRCQIVDRAYATGLDRKYLYTRGLPLMSTSLPHLAMGADETSCINVNACNLATPSLCVYSPGKKRAFILLAEQKSCLGNNGFIVEESPDRSHATLLVTAPGVRDRKPLFIGFTESPDRGATIEAGDTITLRLRLYSFETHGIPGLWDRFMTVRKAVTGPNHARNLIPMSQTAAWMTDRIDSRWYDGPQYKFYCPENATWISFGWVGGLMDTFPMIVLGDDMHLKRVTQTFDFAIPRAQGKSGYFYGAINQDGVNFSRDAYEEIPEISLTRKNADVLFWMVKQFMLLKAQGRADAIKPQWEAHIKRLANAFVTTWRQEGQWGSHVHNRTGRVAVFNTSGGVMAIGGLALAAQYYGQPDCLETAREAAAFYYQRDVVTQGQTTGGCADILQNADSETAAAFMTSLMVLYETTGQKNWLEMSRTLANLCATWTTSYDYELPPDTELARCGAKLAGIYWASTQNKHGAPGICTSSGEALFKIYRATGDRRTADLLHDILHAHAESIRPGGFTNERLTYCDAEPGSVGNRGTHVTGWNELNGILMAQELPGIYVRIDRAELVVFDHVEVDVTVRDNTGVTLAISNQTPYDAKVSVLGETAEQAQTPLGQTAFITWPRVNVPAGATQQIRVTRDAVVVTGP